MRIRLGVISWISTWHSCGIIISQSVQKLLYYLRMRLRQIMMFSRISCYVEQPNVFCIIFKMERLRYVSLQMRWWCPSVFTCAIMKNKTLRSAHWKVANLRAANPKGEGANLLFWPFLHEDCMKLKKKLRGVCFPSTPLDQSMRNSELLEFLLILVSVIYQIRQIKSPISNMVSGFENTTFRLDLSLHYNTYSATQFLVMAHFNISYEIDNLHFIRHRRRNLSKFRLLF